MDEEFTRKYAETMALIPVKFTNDGFVKPVEFHGSAHISALPDADGIVMMETGKKIFAKGEVVSERPI